jgi:hypothetical protein
MPEGIRFFFYRGPPEIARLEEDALYVLECATLHSSAPCSFAAEFPSGPTTWIFPQALSVPGRRPVAFFPSMRRTNGLPGTPFPLRASPERLAPQPAAYAEMTGSGAAIGSVLGCVAPSPPISAVPARANLFQPTAVPARAVKMDFAITYHIRG